MLLMMCGIYSMVSNGNILIRTLKVNPALSGGAIAHIGVAMMLIGILASSGYSKIVSLNNTGLLISKEADDEFNNENLLLFLNEPRTMADYEITYRGDFVEDREHGIFINKNDFLTTQDEYEVIAKTGISNNGFTYYQENDTVEIVPENTFYKIEYLDSDSNLFTLYPRAQVNEAMGLLASPDIKRSLGKDLYTHVSSIPNPDEEKEWSEMEEAEVAVNNNFFVNDYVATLTNMERIQQVEGVELGVEDVAVKATIKVQGETRDYFIQPIFLIKNGLVGRIPDDIPDLGLKITVLNIHPEKGTISLGYNTTQKSWIVMKALEKPLINVLWIGTLILMLGFTIAIVRRYREFKRA
jgi:cytochrome c-type biogenesis protein CcmF